MLFMVERFSPGQAQHIYRTARERGLMLPGGLVYADSLVSASLDVCFQLMECDEPVLFQEWVARWGNLAEREIVPVIPSATTTALMTRLAGKAG